MHFLISEHYLTYTPIIVCESFRFSSLFFQRAVMAGGILNDVRFMCFTFVSLFVYIMFLVTFILFMFHFSYFTARVHSDTEFFFPSSASRNKMPKCCVPNSMTFHGFSKPLQFCA